MHSSFICVPIPTWPKNLFIQLIIAYFYLHAFIIYLRTYLTDKGTTSPKTLLNLRNILPSWINLRIIIFVYFNNVMNYLCGNLNIVLVRWYSWLELNSNLFSHFSPISSVGIDVLMFFSCCCLRPCQLVGI